MLQREHCGLLIIDIQGRLAQTVEESAALLDNCRRLILSVQCLGLPIVWVEQNPQGLGTTVPELADLLTGLQPISKYSFDACGEPAVLQAVQDSGRQQWLLCGIEAHICVFQTARSLLARGYQVELLSDCMASRRLANKQLALTRLQGLGATLSSLEMSLYELLGDCRSEAFRRVLALLR